MLAAIADFFSSPGPWGWLIIAAILFILEAVLPGVYILWFGIAAALVGLVLFVFPAMTGMGQLVLFVVASVASVLVGRYVARRFMSASEQPNLNERGQSYVGRTLVVEEAIADGRGRVRVGDTVWMAEGPDTAAGRRVKVTGTKGTILLVEPA